MSNILRAKFTKSPGIAFSEAPADSFIMFTESNEPLYFGKSNSSNYIAVDGSTKVNNQLLVAKDILPITNATQNIGSSSLHFKEAWIDTVHISSNTLYLGNTPVLGTNQDSIQITADVDQSINIKTTGLGQTSLVSSNGVNITTTGTNKNVDIQASGSGGSVVFGASTGQVVFTTPSTTFSSNVTIQGNTTVLGNFIVSGTTTTVDTTNLNVEDNIITINANDTGVNGVSLGSAGLKVYRGDSADPYQIVFDEVDDKLKVGFGNTTSNLVAVATEPYVHSTIATSNLATQPFVHSVISTSNLATKSYVNTTIVGSNLANQSFVHTAIATSNLATKSYVNTTIVGSNLANQSFVHTAIATSNLATKAYVDASAPSGTLSSASNLSDLTNVTTARNNLGLGTSSTVSFSSINAGGAWGLGNPISARNSSNITTASTIDNYPLVVSTSGGTTTTGIALTSVSGPYSGHTPGASITYDRSGNLTGFKGNMNFNVQTTSGLSNALTTAMTIYNDGDVGIGTTTPAYKLDVVGSTSNDAIIKVGTPTNGDGRIMFGNLNHGIGRGINLPGAVSGNDVIVYTTAAGVGVTTNSALRMYVTVGGNVGIGTSNPTEKLSVSGNIIASGNISAYATVTSSDARLKTNRSLLEDALSTINKLNPQIYDKQTNLVPKEEDPEPRREAGLIAQDIWNYVPELRHTIMNINSNIANEETPIPEDSDIWGELPLGINYTSIIPYLIKALQEQQKQIFELQQKNL